MPDPEVVVGQLFNDHGTMVIVADGGTLLVVDGALVLRQSYPDLYGVIRDTYSTGKEPSDSFRLPDLRNNLIA